ncbi:MAG: hypothetical protein CVU36_12650 [Betaproteobacteria bacterium HGW-Betaproteobacteria-9]|nr:MAG: hypothetical protein CVU36_12650 [Betaproteobacteria bacterium HGW-Betaproteobacteria-9]
MRHIPTTAARVDQLKKQAKRLKATKGGKHADLLNAVAKSAGYDHWHHVMQCHEHAERPPSIRTLSLEVERVLAAELKGDVVIIMTGPEIIKNGPLVLFSTGIGDVWMMDPEDNSAACLMWHGEKKPAPFRDQGSTIEIAWDGFLDLNGQFVSLDCPSIPGVGQRVVGGYPVEPIRKMLNRAQSIERKMVDIFDRVDGVELTDDVVADLVRQGWDAKTLAEGRAGGAMYSTGRNTLLYPAMTHLDDQDESEDHPE